ncbi:hypothetical protein SULYE_1446 [Sulfurihydrogenibium yellowstonense SS-5]|uniref:Uncharacterized protein n=1 Tax=Sulfurihydrogenibium yellowstonense SS-5 TaxID=432331 RepID=C4FLJ2_9AQUI|nr:hypothetical protein SULYE_1446 [Sulfurihydrogenibium yellowstonense SS-5]
MISIREKIALFVIICHSVAGKESHAFNEFLTQSIKKLKNND